MSSMQIAFGLRCWAATLLFLSITMPVLSANDVPIIELERLKVPLNGRPEQICVAAQGTLLAIKIQGQPLCTVIDTGTGRIVKQIELLSAASMLAATRDKLFAIDPEKKLLRKWSLTSWEIEATRTLPGNGVIAAAAGAFGGGPLGLYALEDEQHRGGKLVLVETKSLKPIETTSNSPRHHHLEAGKNLLFCAGDGESFYATRSDGGIYIAQIEDKACEYHYVQDSPGFLASDYSAKRVCTDSVDYSRDLVVDIKREPYNFICLPSYDGEWRMTVRQGESIANLYAPGDSRAICKLSGFPEPKPNESSQKLNLMLFLIAQQSIVVGTDDSLDFYRFDLEEHRNHFSSTYLYVTSAPRTSALPGKTFELPLKIGSSHRHQAKVNLGPAGMAYDANSDTLRWNVPETAQSGSHSVILDISNSAGKSSSLTFSIDVENPGGSSEISSVAAPSTSLVFGSRTTIPKKGMDISLPCEVAAATPAGSGRYIALHLASISSIGIVDLQSRSLSKVFAVSPGEKRLAGTADKLFVYSPSEQSLTRYDLQSGKREESASIVGSDATTCIAAGAYGLGPIGITTPADSTSTHPEPHDLRLLDPVTLKTLVYGLQSGPDLVASSDGRVFLSRASANIFAHNTRSLRKLPPNNPRLSMFGHFSTLNFNGSLVFSYGGFLFSADLEDNEMSVETTPSTCKIPSLSGNLVLHLAVPSSAKAAAVYSVSDSRPILQIENFPELPFPGTGSQQSLRFHDRISFVPDQGLLAVIPVSNNVVHLREFDLAKALIESEADYLYLDSVAPAAVMRGESFVFPLKIISKRGGVSVKLTSAPEGMAVKGHTIAWSVPTNYEKTSAFVEFEISDSSGQSNSHRFKMRIEDKPNSTIKLSFVTSNGRNGSVDGAKAEVSDAELKTKLDFRVWTDTKGRKVEAALLRILDNGSLELQRKDGRKFTVSLETLSPEDVQFAKSKLK